MIKKKGRKPKSYYENLKNNTNIDNTNNPNGIDLSYNNTNDLSNNIDINYIMDNSNAELQIKVQKKRGRKPKGGKVVEAKNILINTIPVPNIILHLNCKLSDIYDNVNSNSNIKYEPIINDVKSYEYTNESLSNLKKYTNLNYKYIENDNQYINITTDNFTKSNDYIIYNKNSIENFIEKDKTETNILNNENNNNTNNNTNNNNNNNNNEIINNENITKKNISKKLKELSYKLKHKNIDNKSSCFWCTYSFNNDSIYIPKYELNNTIFCYGCFCSPECACAYLMNENIDSSSKFERYYLLNNIYGKIFDYTKNIKPAPNPYYLLVKYYGNLNITEYRKLLENEKLLLVLEKPLSQILPEIYEENEDFLINSKIITKKCIKTKDK